MGKFGKKVEHGPRLAYEAGSPIEFEPEGKGVDQQILQARLILARNAAGYNLLRDSLYEATRSRATAVMFDFSPEQTKIRHQVDGVWLDLVPLPRKLGRTKELDIYEEMLEAAKKLVGANPEDRRSKQGGKFKAVISGSKKKKNYDVEFMSQGTQTGDAAIFNLHAQTVPFKTLDEIGIRPELQPKFLEQINGEKGIVLVSAPPAHGLRSTMAVFARVCDRFTKDVANIEDVNSATEPIENVMVGKYDSSKGETPTKATADMLFRGVVTLFVQDMSHAATLKVCCESMLDEDRDQCTVITMLRAKDGVDALQRFLSIAFPKSQVVPHISAVICQRLIRKLCPECKEAYEPEPQILQQFRLNPSQVKQFCRKRTPLPLPQEEAKRGICRKCHGVGYFGRTALFELFTISDAVKSLLLSQAEPMAIRQQLGKEGQQTFLHAGIHLILRGETSVEELSRVMKM
jgi:type II secretory ATPase GspE/PulE/Tfp pilus assembly ATPase PilB-like protein